MTCRRGRAGGFTLVEVVVALFFLSIVVISLASATDYANRVVLRSRTELSAQQFLEAETERLRFIAWDSLADGRRTRGRGIAEWRVVDSTTFRQIMLVTRFGSAGTGLVVDSVVVIRNR